MHDIFLKIDKLLDFLNYCPHIHVLVYRLLIIKICRFYVNFCEGHNSKTVGINNYLKIVSSRGVTQ